MEQANDKTRRRNVLLAIGLGPGLYMYVLAIMYRRSMIDGLLYFGRGIDAE